MTAKELAFANAVIAGHGPSAAYRLAGYAEGDAERVAKRAQVILHRPHVQVMVMGARDKATAKATLSREKKLELLSGRALAAGEDGKKLDQVGIKAIEVHNLMTGDNAPEEVNVFGLGDLLTLVRKRSRK